MSTPICKELGIEIPLFAFTHCRDVVVAVSKAGGFGVLGAASYDPDELDQALTWIDDHIDGKPYGVDILAPATYEGQGQQLSAEELRSRIPAEHQQFVTHVLAEHDVTSVAPRGRRRSLVEDGLGQEFLAVSMRHPIKLIANALGVPPQYMIDAAKAAGIPVAALIGAKEHAVKQVLAGVDILVAQGTEAGGHCGEVTTMVLVPEVIEAIAPIRPVPVLAAGGIVTGRQMAAAVALGAQGAWTGSVWLTTEEAETAPYTVRKMLTASSRDTVRSKARTGKYSRQLRSAWTEAWSAPDAPEPLPMPLQGLLSEPALRQVDRLAERGDAGAQDLATYWVGQGVGLMNRVRPAAEVVYEMATDFAEAAERVAAAIQD
ncbi:putative monooxygenase [Nocardia nova SH22a]|uniref:Putative monooxygenase n=1 Tax=Nocardia nova SH22a TaxID=1415166 RepID=W5TLI2_9NOCA|nr:nitronate monooxygenase family protein [Nocardia nova]AHH19994.1 putative monooxygenase [Nocardia nova SH22a]